jgi:hypothetical protein
MLRGGEDEADYGLDLTALIGSVNTKSDIAALAGRISNELLKDERILSVDVTPVAITDGVSTTFEIAVAAITKEGPFALQLSVDSVTTELLGITVEG